MNDRFSLYIKPDYNFIHWLRDEPNNYKGKNFWWYFVVKRNRIGYNGITVDLFKFTETGKPFIAYHYYNKNFSYTNMWDYGIIDNFTEAWRYIDVPQFYVSFKDVLNTILKLHGKKVHYLCGQYMS